MTEAAAVIEASGRHTEAKRFPLTWAQATMRDYVLALGPEAQVLNLRLRTRLRSPRSTDQVLAALTTFIAAYDVARTTFDAALHTQVIRPTVTVPVHVRDSGGNPVAAGTELLDALAGNAFSPETEPPIRFGLVVDGNEVHSVATALSHLVFDASSMSLVSGLLERSLNGTTEETLQPGDLVRFEATDRMQERSNAELRLWSRTLSALPSGRGFRLPALGSYTEWALHSRAVAVAAQTVAVRTGVSTSSVILAALGAVLRSVLADAPAALLLVTGNRHHPDLAEFAGIATQIALHVIPPEGRKGGADAFVRYTHVSAIRSYARARYDSTRWRGTLTEMTARGAAPDVSCYFNDARTSRGWEGLEHRVEELGSWKASDARVTAVGRHRKRDATLFAHVLDGGTTAQIQMVCDDAVIPALQAEAVLHGLEEYLVKLALA